MQRWGCCWIMSLVSIGALALPAMAFTPRTGQAVVVSEALHDDLYLAGGTVTATAAVDGDVVAAGGTVEPARTSSRRTSRGMSGCGSCARARSRLPWRSSR